MLQVSHSNQVVVVAPADLRRGAVGRAGNSVEAVCEGDARGRLRGPGPTG